MQLKIYQENTIQKLLEEAKKLLGYSDGKKWKKWMEKIVSTLFLTPVVSRL